MDLFTLLKIMWRRWFVVLPVLALAFVFGLLFIGQPAVQYTANGSELLITSSQTDEGANSSEAISPSVASVLLATALRRPAVAAEIRNESLFSTYVATPDAEAGVVTLSVTGDDPDDVLQTSIALLDRAPTALANAVGPDATESIRVALATEPVLEDVILADGFYTIDVPIALIPSEATGNPFMPGGSTIATLVELSYRLDIAQAVWTAVPSASYQVTGSPRSAAPIVAISVTADQPSEVPVAFAIVLDELGDQLAELQSAAGVPPEQQTVLRTLVPPAAVVQTSASIVRPAAGVALLAIGAACGLAVLADLILYRRAARRLRKRISRATVPDEPGSMKSVPDEPGSMKSVPDEPGSMKSVPDEPGSMKSVPDEPGSMKSVPDEPGSMKEPQLTE